MTSVDSKTILSLATTWESQQIRKLSDLAYMPMEIWRIIWNFYIEHDPIKMLGWIFPMVRTWAGLPIVSSSASQSVLHPFLFEFRYKSYYELHITKYDFDPQSHHARLEVCVDQNTSGDEGVLYLPRTTLWLGINISKKVDNNSYEWVKFCFFPPFTSKINLSRYL
jgi:hypothetical protein